MHSLATRAAYQHVAAAVISNQRGEVLLALRPAHLHQGGLWEFPGGKVKANEDVLAALTRELREELGITPTRMHPLIRIRHNYPDKKVLLDVWRVDSFQGEPNPHEGQQLEWVVKEDLSHRSYPAANLPIVTAAKLPALYLISPEPGQNTAVFMNKLESGLRGGATLIQLRAKTLGEDAYRLLAEQALALCRRYSADLLLNAPPRLAEELNASGVHLTSERLMGLDARTIGRNQWLAASCHTPLELAHALRIGVDFAVVSPVLATASHPGAAALGWLGLRCLTEQANVPVYALGGMGREYLTKACQYGAQGVAVIANVWNSPCPERAVAELLQR